MKLTHIKVSKILRNCENPRGIDIPTQDDKLAYLKDSISKFGIMVPIVVSKKKNHYLLIDGERRYWAASALGLNEIPAYIIDENGSFQKEEILFRMFQIHHNREQWGPIQQCHALETVYQQAAKKKSIISIVDERAKINAIGEELVKITGIEERTAISRVYFLRWPEKIKQNLYQNPSEDYWYICEIEEKIIIPAIVNYPEYFQKVPVDEVREDLFSKLQAHSVEKSTEVRRVAPFFRNPITKLNDRNKFQKIFSKLHRNKEMTYAEAQDELTKNFPDYLKRDPISPRKLQSMIHSFRIALEDFDISSFQTAKKRCKADKNNLKLEIQNLMDDLNDFLMELK